MKTRKLLPMGFMALTLIFMSCSGEDGSDGEIGPSGINGLACWDTSGDGIKDTDEDINGDGKWNALDCQGTKGADGDNGDPGNDGAPGAPGADGTDCWDLNGNGSGDITDGEDNEDINGDNKVDALDCQGEKGEDGDDGNPGADGQDGNANVQKFIFDLDPIPAGVNSWSIAVEEFTLEFLEAHTLLFFFKIDNPVNYMALPGSSSVTGRSYEILLTNQTIILNTLGNDGDLSKGWTDIWEELHVTAIEHSVLQNKSGHTDPIKALKAAGIDSNDYHAVMQFFGVED